MIGKNIIGVVILNFKAYEETIDCVRSFINQTFTNIEIIIVENGSGNESEIVLKKTFGYNEDVHLIISDTNLGFAKGNNLGIRYARNVLGCTDIIVINSDTIVQRTFVEELINGKEKGVAVISPTVINLNGDFQQPSVNTSNMPKEIIRTCKNIFITSILRWPIIRLIYKKYSSIDHTHNRCISKEVKAYYLQGCSYMLTNEFFKHYTQLYPKTFLYWEELNLLWYIYKAGLKSCYVHTSPVLHKVAVSTEMLVGKENKRKEKFVYDSMKKSICLYFSSYSRIKKKYC